MIKIPVYQPFLGGNEKKYVLDCIESNWISSKGKYVHEFEEEFAQYIGVKHATSVCNGTVALHLALLALDIKAEDEIIVPSFTYIASVNAIAYLGAKPVFVDSDSLTWQIATNSIRNSITEKTKAIMAVHLYGFPCDMNEIMQIAKEFNLYVIEDCSESLGSTLNGKHLGTFGDIATFSFFGNKTITTGEGGMVATNNTKLHEYSSKLKNQGLAGTKQYWHDIIGYNFRMTNICAAIGKAQLEKIDEILNKKQKIAFYYKTNLSDLPFDFLPERDTVENSFWMFTLLVKEPFSRDALMSFLSDAGIETRPTFYPAHEMPMYYEPNVKFTIAEDISKRGMNLPSYPELNESQLNEVVLIIRSFFSK